ncbi:hypothetical protein AB1Y20_013371 [Prymnesium parvum]|uniref:L-ornithine N(5)-monooxygenase n=1 Tax=Prymnesium parvum TaxID=97485 RepID=A0AB34IHP3_PRYPA
MASMEEFDLVVVGAGPHALSLLGRLVEDSPDLLTERRRASVAARAGSRGPPPAALRRGFASAASASAALRRVLVIDAHGAWLAQWSRDFAALRIRYTRSHADLHPCACAFASLRSWAQLKRRTAELLPLHAPREHGFGGPFTAPSTRLFEDFCAALVARYGLAPLLRAALVTQIHCRPAAPSAGGPSGFELRLADGSAVGARRVVLAIGPGPAFEGMRKTLPWWAETLQAELHEAGVASRLRHSQQLVEWLSGGGAAELRGSRVLLIGGGQTCAHLALLACGAGCERVVVAARRRLMVKPFDVNLELVGDRRGELLDKFAKIKTAHERLAFISGMRGGGSMSPEVHSELMRNCVLEGEEKEEKEEVQKQEVDGVGEAKGNGAAAGRLLEEVEVHEAHWATSAEGGEFDAYVGCPLRGRGEVAVRFDDGRAAYFDHVWLATGGALDLRLVPLLASLLEQRPIPTAGGLPQLQPDLAWDSECPLYVMGAFAQLVLGPDALNLAGARSGGVLVAKALRPHVRVDGAP